MVRVSPATLKSAASGPPVMAKVESMSVVRTNETGTFSLTEVALAEVKTGAGTVTESPLTELDSSLAATSYFRGSALKA
jgi:hypothetical protein